MYEDTFTLTETYALETKRNGAVIRVTVSDDLETAWESCKGFSQLPGVRDVTLYRIGTHSNYGNPLTGTTTTPFVNGHACNTATRYS